MAFVPFGQPAVPEKRRRLDREQVVAAALDLLQEVGLDALTMRLLAERLGVRAASLYRHVRDKEELLIHLADAVSARAEDVPPGGPWRKRLVRMIDSYLRALRGIRDGARLLAETPPAGPNRLRKIDAILGAVVASGCTPEEAVTVCYHLNNLIVGFATDEERAKLWVERAGIRPEDLAERKRAFSRMLSLDEYPNLAAMAEFAGSNDPDAVFRSGIAMFLDGLEAQTVRRR